jgi:hypothetical protein
LHENKLAGASVFLILLNDSLSRWPAPGKEVENDILLRGSGCYLKHPPKQCDRLDGGSGPSLLLADSSFYEQARAT